MVPPVTVKSIDPVAAPLHNTFTWVRLKVAPEVLVMTTETVFVQLLASVTVTV